MVFDKSWVSVDISAETLGGVASFAFGAPSIVFSDRDLPKPKYRSDPLHITVSINGHEIRGALIDTGVSFNVMPVHTLRNIKILESKTCPVCHDNCGF